MADQVQEQIVREAPEIEQYKVGLLGSAKSLVDAANANALLGNYLTPDYQVATLSPDQLAALKLGRQGIGAYQPYLTAATQGTARGQSTLAEAANILRGADTRNQFAAAQSALNQAAVPISMMGTAANVAGAGIPLIGQGAQGLAGAQQLALGSLNQPGFQQGIGTLYEAARDAKLAAQLGPAAMASAASVAAVPDIASRDVAAGKIQAARSGFVPTLQTFQMGPAQQVTTKTIADEGTVQKFMSPYQQAVTDIAVREAQRQDEIARQSRNAQAIRSNAFGGSRQAVLESEAARNLAQLKSDLQVRGMQDAYMAALQQFNVEQQANLAAQQANQQAGIQVGAQNLGSQLATQQLKTQAQLQVELANLSNEQQAAVVNEANALQAQGMNQQAALQAAMSNQQTKLTSAVQNAQLAQQASLANQAAANQQAQIQAQLKQAAAQQLAAAGTGQIGATVQQAGLQQNAANLYGNLAGQTAGLASLYGNVGAQQAGILGQQSQLSQSLGQGIGNLAAQQFGVGQNIAQGLGALGTQQGNLGMQQAALGQQAQAQSQQDVNMMFNLGATQQRQLQSELDAARQNTLQQNMQPYQQLGFLSDIYKGAPTSQMSSTSLSQAAPSAFQQVAGLGIGATTAAAAASRAGII